MNGIRNRSALILCLVSMFCLFLTALFSNLTSKYFPCIDCCEKISNIDRQQLHQYQRNKQRSSSHIIFFIIVCKMSDCCLTPIQQFFSYIMARTS